ncbi:MAG: hypothetical protein DRP35_07765 [Candidatus Zixiibacteriota bacterium]|nr:MAG: hypothetical protein DRP35_07765 [candidate division Zixibacteria bacterium]
MRFIKILPICFVLLLMFVGVSNAQYCSDFKDCSEIVNWAVDTTDWVKIISVENTGEDTLWMPINMTNLDDTSTTYNEAVTAFLFQFKYDPTYLTPAYVPGDTNLYIVAEPVNRLKTITDSNPNIFYVQESRLKNDSIYIDTNVIRVIFGTTFNPGQGEPPSIPAGSDVVCKIPFIVDAGMPEGESSVFSFYQINDCVSITDCDPSDQQEFDPGISCSDCRRTQFSIKREREMVTQVIDFIDGSVDPPDTIWRDSVYTGIAETNVYSIVTGGAFTKNLTPPPTINSFAATPSTVSSGSNSALDWDVTGADSITISGNGYTYASTELSGFVFVTPPTATGIYDYTLSAFNVNGEVSATATIEVTDGGGDPDPDNNSPAINVASAFTVEEGQLLSFSVTATDADATDNITLSAQSLPNNATFNQVVGTSSVTGTFSWTPDIGQIGFYNITFSASDGKTTTNSSVGITVTQIQGDRLFSTSAVGNNPVGGLKGKKEILFPIDLVTAQTVYGVQFEFVYDYQNFKVDSIITTNRTLDYVIYDNIGQSPGVIKIVTFGLANESIQTDSSTAILYAAMSIDSIAAPGDYPIFIQDGWESVNPDPSVQSLELLLEDGVIQVDLPGDVNLDQRIDVADLVNVVAYIIGDFGLPTRQFEVADVILNDTVDVFDLVGVINLLYGIPVEPSTAGQSFATGVAKVNLDYEDMAIGENSDMLVTSELPVDIGGVQLEIQYDPTTVKMGTPIIADDADNLQLITKDNGYGKMIILMHLTNPFNDNALITAGNADLVNIPIEALSNVESGNKQQVKITQALLSTSDAFAVSVEGFGKPLPQTFALKQNYPNPFNPITTIEFSLGVGDEGAIKKVNLDIYNILGRHVISLVDDNLLPGHYSIEWDATDNSGRKTATGIYLYRLKVGSELQTKKMLLLK